VTVSVPAFPLFVRDAARPAVLQAVEAALGALDGRADGAPPTADAWALLARVLGAHVLRARSTSSERPRLATLMGLRLDDLARAEALDTVWASAVLTQALRDELELIALAWAEQLRALRIAAAGGSGRGRQILSRLPAFMRADRAGKALGTVAHALGRDLDEADRLLGTVRDAHALAAADEERDLLQLAAALGLQRADFLLLSKLHEHGYFVGGDAADADPHDRAAAAYARYTTDLRQAIGRYSRILMRGCATIPALLEGAMVLVNGDPRDPLATPGAPREPEADARYPDHILIHPDAGLPRGGFIHGLPIRYGTLEAQGTGFERRERDGHVYLVENPITDKQSPDAPRHGRDRFRVRRGGFFHGPVAARITGSGDRSVRPRLTNLRTHRGLGYAGNVPDGAEFIFTTDGRAFLDGTEVTAQCHVFKGALFGESPFDDATAPQVFVQSVPAGALDRNRPLAALEPAAALPTLRLLLGDSDWQFDVEEGAYDASDFDACVFALPADDATRAALPPSAQVQLLWREHQPFTARVLLPAALQSLEPVLLDGTGLRSLVRAGLERFRAAGIRLEVNWFDDTWVLDESVLRDLATEAGLGVTFDGTFPAPVPGP
jgi:hypothetical protein